MPTAPNTMYGPDYFHVDVKPGVVFTPIAAGGIKLLWALQECCRVLRVNLLLAAGTNGHTAPSRHVTGEAVDVSVHGLSVEMTLAVRTSLMALLGSNFYVQFEVPTGSVLDPRLAAIAVYSADATGPHLHAQVAKGVVWPPRSGSLTVNAEPEPKSTPVAEAPTE